MSSRSTTLSRRQALRLIAATAAGAGLLSACAPTAPAQPAAATPASAAKPAATTAPAAAAPPAASKPAPAAGASTGGPAATAAPAAASSAGTPVRGGSTIISLDIDPIQLDVQKQVTLWSTQATEHMYDSLTVFDENMEVKPSLAESWETPDPTTYIFHLRKGVKWHNGREFVASDVAYWHQRIMDPKIGASQRGSWMIVKQLDIVDDYTVKLSLSKPSASLLALFATMRESAIPNKETVEKNGDLANIAVGTGPYKLAEFVPGDHVRYVRNPDYWVKDLPYLDEFTLKVMPEEDQRIAALRSGQIHLGVLSPVGAQRLASESQLTVMHSPKALVMMILINSQKKPFDDVRVRKALSLAIDRQAFITKAVQGEGVISGPTPTGHTDWFVPPEQLPYKQDIEGAKKLLAEAGLPNGFKTTIKTTGAIPEQSANAVELKNQLQAIGIDLSIEQLEVGAHTKATGVGSPADQINDYDLITSNFTFYPGPDTYVGNFLPERNAITRGANEGMKNPQITALLDKAEATQDHAERRKLYIDAQLQLIEMYPALWLYAVNQIDGVSDKLKGYKQSFTARRYLIKQAWAG